MTRTQRAKGEVCSAVVRAPVINPVLAVLPFVWFAADVPRLIHI